MSPVGLRLRGVVAATLALLAASAGPVRAQEPAQADSLALHSGKEVVEVEFVGEQAVPAIQLVTAIRTREENCTLLALLCWLGWGVDDYYLDPEVLAADVLRLRLFYYERGFRRAQVTPSVRPVEDGVVVRFTVVEGEPVRVGEIGFGGDAEAVASILKAATPLREGEPLDLVLLQESRDTLQGRLRNRGYAQAEVLAGYMIPTDSPLVGRVTFDVYPGQPVVVGSIRVVSNDSGAVSPRLVRRMLTFGTGDAYREAEVVASQRQIYALEVFTHASIVAHTDSVRGDSIPVTVNVLVGDVHRVRLGVGLNSLDCVNAEGRWISRSFFGGARRLEIGGRISNLLTEELRWGGEHLPCSEAGVGDPFGTLNGGVSADFVQPWFLGPRNALGAGLNFERRTVPDVFVRDTRGGYVSLTHQLSARTTGSVAYRPALTSFVRGTGDDPFFCVSFQACDPASVEVLRNPNWLAPLGASLAHDASNSVFAPTDGYIVRFDAEVASNLTGSAFQYVRLSADAASYFGLPGSMVLATHLRPGWGQAIGQVEGDVDLGLHPQRRFYAGGPNSVRGFAQSRLGPKILTVNGTRLAAATRDGGAACTASSINDGSCDAQAMDPNEFDPRPTGGTVLLEGSVELRYPIWGPVRGVVFADAGQLWDDELDLGSLAVTPGFGVRYYSPIGPIRIDVGYNPTGAEVLPVRATGVEVCADEAGEPIEPCVSPDPGVYYPPSRLGNTNTLNPLDPVSWQPRDGFFDRLQIHFSIGQAF